MEKILKLTQEKKRYVLFAVSRVTNWKLSKKQQTNMRELRQKRTWRLHLQGSHRQEISILTLLQLQRRKVMSRLPHYSKRLLITKRNMLNYGLKNLMALEIQPQIWQELQTVKITNGQICMMDLQRPLKRRVSLN